jgi:predicted transposase YbfD/YdcC
LPVPEGVDPEDRWPDLRSVGMVICERTVGGKTTAETRYYITSLESDAAELARAVRAHWRIENSLHWVLDVVFREDDSRLRMGHSAQNFAVIRHLALNLLKQEQTLKRGIKSKRMKAAMDTNYLLRVLQPAL